MLWFGLEEVKCQCPGGMAYFSNLSTRNYRKHIEFGALCLLAIGILWWFGRKLNWSEVGSAVSHSNPYLLSAATAVICLAYLFRACRWGALLRPLGPARLSDLFAATTVGFGAVFIVGRAGEVVRPIVLPMRDPRVRATASFVTIMVERIYDMMAVVLLFSINLLWFKPPIKLGNEFERVRLAGVILLLGAILGVAGLMWFRKKSGIVVKALERFFARLHFIPRRLSKLILSTLEQLARALRVLADARELAETAAWTAIIWCSIGLASLLVIRAFGVPFGVSETIFVLGWSLVGSLVPTPGGAAGAFHAATAAGLIFLGVSRETSAAISIVLHVIDFGPAVFFGFFYVIRGDLNLSRLRSLASPETVEHAVEDETLVPDDIHNDEKRVEGPAPAGS
jgi:glycosyltransferase 2 family protein